MRLLAHPARQHSYSALWQPLHVGDEAGMQANELQGPGISGRNQTTYNEALSGEDEQHLQACKGGRGADAALQI